MEAGQPADLVESFLLYSADPDLQLRDNVLRYLFKLLPGPAAG